MKLHLPLVALCALAVALVSLRTAEAAPAPPLQLPWPTGTLHRIGGGNTYGCGTHSGSHQYAIDFEFGIDGFPGRAFSL